MIAKEGVPSFYVKLLANLEDLLAATLKDKPAVKKMSATNTRSLNRMKLQLRKHNKTWVGMPLFAFLFSFYFIVFVSLFLCLVCFRLFRCCCCCCCCYSFSCFFSCAMPAGSLVVVPRRADCVLFGVLLPLLLMLLLFFVMLNARSYEKEIADFRTNPSNYADDSESDSDSDDSDSDSDSEDSSDEDSDSDDAEDSDAAESDDSDDSSDDARDAKASKPVKPQKVGGCVVLDCVQFHLMVFVAFATE